MDNIPRTSQWWEPRERPNISAGSTSKIPITKVKINVVRCPINLNSLASLLTYLKEYLPAVAPASIRPMMTSAVRLIFVQANALPASSAAVTSGRFIQDIAAATPLPQKNQSPVIDRNIKQCLTNATQKPPVSFLSSLSNPRILYIARNADRIST